MDNLVEHTDISVEHAARERREDVGDNNRGRRRDGQGMVGDVACDSPNDRHQGLTFREKVPG